jgi:hypothetical protein
LLITISKFQFSYFFQVHPSSISGGETMSSRDKVDKSKQVQATAGKTTSKSSNDAKSNVTSTAKETKRDEKDLTKKKKYESEDDDEEDDNVCTLNFVA